MATDARPLLLGVGEILWDLLPSGRQLGGAPANFSFHAGQLGGCGVPVSCIGDDQDGRDILDVLMQVELDAGFISVDKSHPTGTVTVVLDADGKPGYTIHENVAWDNICLSDTAVELAAGADAVCFGSLAQRNAVSRATIFRLLDSARPSCLRVFDINLRQHYFDAVTIIDSLGRADVLKLNDEELPVVADLLSVEKDESQFMQSLSEQYGLRAVALTRGSAGSMLYADGVCSEFAGIKTEIADTVGAGDAFTAALIVGLLKGRSLDAINTHANRVAAYVCTQSGAMPRLPAELREI